MVYRSLENRFSMRPNGVTSKNVDFPYKHIINQTHHFYTPYLHYLHNGFQQTFMDLGGSNYTTIREEKCPKQSEQ